MAKKEEEEQSMEAHIERALNSHIQHFQDNADSLTLESVRRLLEKDLGLEVYALDVHKRFIKRLIEKEILDSFSLLQLVIANRHRVIRAPMFHLISALLVAPKNVEGPDDDAASENSLKHDEKNVSSTKIEAAESPQKNEIKKDRKEPAFEDGMKTDDSPIMGLMTTKINSVDSQSTKITESKIKKAIWDRASHIKDNSETITPVRVRRLLEEDLGLPINTLDPFKKFIRTQIDEVLESSKVNKSATGLKKKRNSGNNQIDIPEKNISETSAGSLDSENDEVDEKAKSRKKAAAPREKDIDKSVGLKKRKGPEKEVNVSSKKQKKIAKKTSDVDSDEGDDESGSDDLQSEISSETNSKKKQLSTPGYEKRVENIKSIIKACGMSVAPSVYKKAKQVSDGKREGFLIKELEEILSREGLSTNPTEKEIKEVRKRKERAKELEGINLSNIVSSSRRRTTTTFMAPPKPKVRAERPVKDTISTKKNENEDDDVDKEAPEKKEEEKEGEEEEEKEEKEEKEGEDDDDDDDSQSEEFNEDCEDSD